MRNRALWIRYAAGIMFLTSAVISWTVYASQMSVVRAIRGARNPTEHQHLLRRAVALDPSNGLARLQLARALSVGGRHEEALQMYETGRETYRPFTSYEEVGRLQERLGNADPQRLDDMREKARTSYESGLLLNPGNISLLKRMAELALRMGDREAVRDYASLISQRSLNDMDANYFLALDAQGAGETQRAYRLFQQISARDQSGSQFYTTQSIAQRLKDLEKRGARRDR